MSLLHRYSNKIDQYSSAVVDKYSYLLEFNQVHYTILEELMRSMNLASDLDFKLIELFVRERAEYR